MPVGRLFVPENISDASARSFRPLDDDIAGVERLVDSGPPRELDPTRMREPPR